MGMVLMFFRTGLEVSITHLKFMAGFKSKIRSKKVVTNIKCGMDNLFRVVNLIQCNLVSINLKMDNTDQIEFCKNLDLIDGMTADLLVMPD